MFEKIVFSFTVPMTNIVYYGYSLFRNTILVKTVYYTSEGLGMSAEEAETLADTEISTLTTV
jgi:hypothetical protein